MIQPLRWSGTALFLLCFAQWRGHKLPSQAFVQKAATTSVIRMATNLHNSSPKRSSEEEERRMEMVRKLQRAFYQPSDEDLRPELNATTGIMTNVPLWRVQWTELPGRSNVLHVHEGQYTNMFEKILYGPKPWYFGHLFLPGGSTHLKTDKAEYQLKTWKDEAADTKRVPSRTAVVGTLMRISDYRRMKDGRLMILVHALERFVVQEIVQTLPHSIAHVQILPDFDDPLVKKNNLPEAIQESFAYQSYEYAQVELPLDKSEYLGETQILGSQLAKVLPFAPYSTTPTSLPSRDMLPADAAKLRENEEERAETITLTRALLDGKVLQAPPSHPEFYISSAKPTSKDAPSLDSVETMLWLSLETFSRLIQKQSIGFQLPPHLVQLVPPEMKSYLDVPSSPDIGLADTYPAYRRQRRLSFAASFFLEATELGKGVRQLWLETPSTYDRLKAVQQRFELLNAMLGGGTSNPPPR